MKWETKRVAQTCGIVWGAMIFLMTLISVPTDYAHSFLSVIASIYPGYTITMAGSIVGLIYGFLDAFIGVYVTVWVYNQLGKKK